MTKEQLVAHMLHYLANLKHKQTGDDPKTNAHAYAEVPDWALRQWIDGIRKLRQ